ncbi:uncharacterized protein CEXT_315381 [Caerostris extrusa]|uniref:Secreted protein n=1 Tax=Caerostris extrusa TaxID=172846 RepID=A0AAV4QDK9_CAEEX|nr:uncharacterized protein CEXT_315381 [Caerostris extrusa]
MVVVVSSCRLIKVPFLLLNVIVGCDLLWSLGVDGQLFGNYTMENSNVTIHRIKRRTQPQNGFFFPIAMYTVRHHKPPNDRGREVRPETWEYRGQYFYGYRPKPNSGRRRAARLLAAGLPPFAGATAQHPLLLPCCDPRGSDDRCDHGGRQDSLGCPLLDAEEKDVVERNHCRNHQKELLV